MEGHSITGYSTAYDGHSSFLFRSPDVLAGPLPPPPATNEVGSIAPLQSIRGHHLGRCLTALISTSSMDRPGSVVRLLCSGEQHMHSLLYSSGPTIVTGSTKTIGTLTNGT